MDSSNRQVLREAYISASPRERGRANSVSVKVIRQRKGYQPKMVPERVISLAIWHSLPNQPERFSWRRSSVGRFGSGRGARVALGTKVLKAIATSAGITAASGRST